MASSFFTETQLKNLYLQNNLSTYDIAELTSCDPKTVYYWLRKFGISTRSRKIISADKNVLKDLYSSGLSLSDIGKQFDCTPAAIFRKFRKYGINTRTPWQRNIIHPRNDFSGNVFEKAYLIGFRIGDLNVKQKSPNSLIIVKSNTTHHVQIKLLKGLFSKYGPIWIGQPKNKFKAYSFTTSLNNSFRFLITKHLIIPKWILSSKDLFLSFLGGYTDAEGSIGIYNNRARFRLGSYDKLILKQIHVKLIRLRIPNSFRLETKKGIYKNKKLNGNFYRVDIMDKQAIFDCLTYLLNYLRHEGRRNCALDALNNVSLRK